MVWGDFDVPLLLGCSQFETLALNSTPQGLKNIGKGAPTYTQKLHCVQYEITPRQSAENTEVFWRCGVPRGSRSLSASPRLPNAAEDYVKKV